MFLNVHHHRSLIGAPYLNAESGALYLVRPRPAWFVATLVAQRNVSWHELTPGSSLTAHEGSYLDEAKPDDTYRVRASLYRRPLRACGMIAGLLGMGGRA